MATVSNSSRISGLASGLDVESIIDGLTQGTQTKISKAKQDLETLEWKKEAYQSITDALYSFQNTYCGSSNTAMLSVSDLKTLTATSSSGYITAATTENSISESLYISDIVSLASSAKVTSSSAVSAAPTFKGDLATLSALSGKSLNVTLDGTTKTLTFSDKSYSTFEDARTELQSLLNGAFGTGRVSVALNGNTFSLSTGNSILSLNNSGSEGNEVSTVLSFTDGASNRLALSSTVEESNLALSPGDTFSFTVNGENFSFSSSSSIQKIMNQINSSDAGVVMSYSKTTDTFTMVSSETGSASTVKLADTEGSFLSSIFGAGVYTNGSDAVLRVGFNGDTDESSLITLTRSSNTFDIDGTSYTLTGKASGTTAEEVSVSVGLDPEAAAAKVTKFIRRLQQSDENHFTEQALMKLCYDWLRPSDRRPKKRYDRQRD